VIVRAGLENRRSSSVAIFSFKLSVLELLSKPLPADVPAGMVSITKALLGSLVAAISMTLMGCGGKCDTSALAAAGQVFAKQVAACAVDLKCVCASWDTYTKAYDENTGGCTGSDKTQADAAMKQMKATMAAGCSSTLAAEPGQSLLDMVSAVAAAIEQSKSVSFDAKLTSTSPVDVV
jgi:hypothetical protein